MSAGAHPSEATRRVSILRGVRAAARRQADVARSAADDFEAAGDPRMAQMLRRHAEHLEHAAAWAAVPCSAPIGAG